jgi:hypothetical protein
MDKLEQDIQEIKKTLESQAEILTRISTALSGDRVFGTKGIVDQCKENTDYIEKDKLFKAKVTGIATGISTFFAIITSIIMKSIFNK